MRKSILKDLIILIGFFIIVWAAFVFLPIFPDDADIRISIDQEEQLGKLIIKEVMENDLKEIHNPFLDSTMLVIKSRLLEQVGLTEYEHKIKVIEGDQVNAFTLPGGNIFVFSGLLKFANHPEEVAAVLAHEIGHVEKRHVVDKLMKDIGITLLFSVISGSDPALISEITGTALSTVFDRKSEKEADLFALQLMEKAAIHPSSLATFFRKIKREYKMPSEELEILLTHPHANSRIKASLEYKLPDDFQSVPFNIDWERVKDSLD